MTKRLYKKAFPEGVLAPRITILATYTFLAIGLLFFMNGQVYGEQGPHDWQYQKEILFQGSEEYHYFFLDEEVYRHAREDLGDLRIMDRDGEFIPYIIDYGYRSEATVETIYRSQIIHTMEKENTTVTDFLIQKPDDSTDVQGNLLVVSLPNREFLKFVEVSGSYDGQRWEALGEYKLYNTGQLKRDTIPFDNVYKYTHYRLEILDNLEKIQLEGLQLIHNEQLSNWVNYSDTVELPFDVIHEDRHTKVQFQNENRLKIAAIRFSLEGNFRRSVSAVDHEGRPLNIQGESELYQILFEQVQVENKELRFPQPVAAEEIVITVFNEDSAPLNITGIEVVYYMDRLIFEGSVQEPLQLLYGNPEARSPVYDLANFKTYILREPLQEASVSRGTEQPDFTKERGSEAWGPLSFQRLFQIAIILASIVLVVLIGTKLSRQNKNNDA